MIFSISETGSSHLPKNIPCQDHSYCYENSDGSVKLVMVCDGHGESCCCRSQRGSFLASRACKKNVLLALDQIGSMIEAKSGAVTAVPEGMDQLWGRQNLDPESDLYGQLQEQGALYESQVKNSLKVERRMRQLFSDIQKDWWDGIRHDLELQPFTPEEKAALGKHPPERAYGTTLMCYVQARTFWFAFQVGDGRLLLADKVLSEGDASSRLCWKQPVPWDCRCFLNHTTSLCSENAVEKFRYAYDGSGLFPDAAFCCSDGIEDSFGDYEGAPQGLHDFFSQVVRTLRQEGVSETMEKLHTALPEISRLRSHDDMSLAGVLKNYRS